MRRRLVIILIVVIVLLLVTSYALAGLVIYNRLSDVSEHCADHQNTPQAFSAPDVGDTQPYHIETYETVTFPSRDTNISLSGWYAPAQDEADAPAVIVIHGLKGCKRNAGVLLAGGMLHRNGFNVLLMDIRDHGDSTIEDNRYAGGTEEYRDVLGGWDWLVAEKGLPPERIGLMGMSLGAATVMIAAGEESRVAAVWEDSGFADLRTALDAELTRNGYPTFLASAGLFMARLIAGDDITAFSPLAAVDKLDGRPVFITHGTADERLSVQYAADLAEAVRASGGEIEPWLVEDAAHTEAVFSHADEYEERLVNFFRESLK